MQDIDLRYAFILLPLLYVIMPYVLTGSFIILGGITVLSFIVGGIILVLISNLHIQGSGSVIGSGVSGSVSESSEGGYALFVLCIGGIFYLGAQITQFVLPLINDIMGFFSFLFGLFGVNFNIVSDSISGLQGAKGVTISNFFPLGLTFDGISIFGAIDIFSGVIFCLGIYFMIASRGH